MPSTLHIDEEIFQDMVRFYGETFNLPPLSAKIYSYLIFDFERKGICFDDFIQIFSASKSSVSANLNLLLNAELIRDFNTINGRKRLFMINDNYINIRFSAIINKMKQELLILDNLQKFRGCANETDVNRFLIYRQLLNKNIETIEETLDKI
ncbi:MULTISPECIES: transcriptional regulator [Kaistella]|jgi:DNA-binding transcriptional regulator GbsR (MarR family)|uniref:Transcriptional regulator n=1 Tax=Kaistella pullorum TaxID=2763074 RepID=A0ABR8WKL6_9FLAO|nr:MULTISPECIES: transcriptional regulator [Kaistella]MBD8017508.1 transcriptional regulator [Kaistella pullorum]